MTDVPLTADDAVAIQSVVVKYGFLIDDREFDRLGEVFTEDASVDLRPDSSEGIRPMNGLTEIEQGYAALSHPVQHMLVSQLLEPRSADEVIVRSKALIPLENGAIADIAYRDVVVRTAQGWRIKDKRVKSYR